MKQQVRFDGKITIFNLCSLQIRDHIKTDYSGNAVADRACQLSKTKAYMMRHMGDIIPEVELILYQLVCFKSQFYQTFNTSFQAYILAKYLNSKKVVNDAEDRRVQKSARNNLYGYLYKRIKVWGLFLIIYAIIFSVERYIIC